MIDRIATVTATKKRYIVRYIDFAARPEKVVCCGEVTSFRGLRIQRVATPIGVIGMIQKIVTEDGPITRKGILAKLMKEFPDRSEDSMNNTIKVQLPARMAKEKGITIVAEKGKDGEVAYSVK